MKSKDKKIQKCKLFFSITASMPYLESQDFVPKIQFLSYAYNLARGKVILPNDELIRLVGMHYAADFAKDGKAEDFAEKRIGNYLPVAEDSTSAENFAEGVLKEFKTWKSKARAVIIKEYLKIVSDTPTFGAHLFSGKVPQVNPV